MIKKRITYVNYDGEKVTEDLYFNLNTVEQTKFLAKYTSGGFKDVEAYAKYLQDKKDSYAMVEMLLDLILSSYGKKTPDGKFIKTKEVKEEFEYSEAYAELFEQLFTNQEEFQKFATGVFKKQEVMKQG